MTLWEMSVSGGILILVILAARRLFQNRLPRHTFLILWMAAVLRLLAPWSVEAPFSVYSLLESSGIADGLEGLAGISGITGLEGDGSSLSGEGAGNGIWNGSGEGAGNGIWNGFGEGAGNGIWNGFGEGAGNGIWNGFGEGAGNGIWNGSDEEAENAAKGSGNEAVSAEPNSLSAGAGFSLLKILYLSGALLCAGVYLTAYLKYRRIFRTSLPVEDPAVWECVQSVPLKRRVQVRSLDLIVTPMTYGVLRPVILLPKGIQWEDSRQMKFVLTHELIHVRRFDAVWKFLLVSAACIHWFNPLVWIMQILANRDLELACDEKVIERFGQDSKRAYAMSLINLAEQKSSLVSWGSGFSKNAMEERIAAIMKKRKFTVGSLTGSGILVMFMAVLFAASALQNTVEKDTVAEAETEENNSRGLAETEENDSRSLAETEENNSRGLAETEENDSRSLAETEKNDSRGLTETAESDNRGLAGTETAETDKVPDLERFNSEGMVLLPLPKKNPTDVSGGIDSETVWESDVQEPFVLFLENISRSAEFSEYEKYGLSYDREGAHFLYNGEIVGYFKDEMGPNLFRKFTDEEGTVGIVVKRDDSWNMTGFTVESAEEKQ